MIWGEQAGTSRLANQAQLTLHVPLVPTSQPLARIRLSRKPMTSLQASQGMLPRRGSSLEMECP